MYKERKKNFITIMKSLVGLFLIIGIIVVLLFQIPPKTTTTPVKIIEKHIAGKEVEIHHYETKVLDQKKIIATIGKELKDLQDSLEIVKGMKDSVLIIQIQDTVINVLSEQNRHLFKTVGYQDSIIVAQRYVINSQDTVIAMSKSNLKKIKRQRNWAIVGNIAQGVIIGSLLLKK